VLVALRTYSSGRSLRGDATWTPVQRIVDALDEAFYLAFGAVEPAGKRTLLALDVSGSMSMEQVAGTPLTAREASAAMAMMLAATEPTTHVIGFTGGARAWVPTGARKAKTAGNGPYARQVSELRISPRMRLDDAVREVSDLPFGATDCALPTLYALERGLKVDTSLGVTDNEAWAGSVHPPRGPRAVPRTDGDRRQAGRDGHLRDAVLHRGPGRCGHARRRGVRRCGAGRAGGVLARVLGGARHRLFAEVVAGAVVGLVGASGKPGWIVLSAWWRGVQSQN